MPWSRGQPRPGTNETLDAARGMSPSCPVADGADSLSSEKRLLLAGVRCVLSVAPCLQENPCQVHAQAPHQARRLTVFFPEPNPLCGLV